MVISSALSTAVSFFQSLLELHKRRKAVTEPEARYYMTQLLKGVQYLHNNRIIHRDLKLGNIFLNDDMDVKIGKNEIEIIMVKNRSVLMQYLFESTACFLFFFFRGFWFGD